MKDRKYIYDDDWKFDEAGKADWLEETSALRPELADMDDYQTDIEYYRHVESYLDDEKANLDIDVPGTIVAFGWISLWDGKPRAWRVVGSNIRDILEVPGDCAGPSWYVEDGDVYGRFPHHDGVNVEAYRLCSDVDRLEAATHAPTVASVDDYERAFFANTTSLAPYVNRVYGWHDNVTEYGNLQDAVNALENSDFFGDFAGEYDIEAFVHDITEWNGTGLVFKWPDEAELPEMLESYKK